MGGREVGEKEGVVEGSLIGTQTLKPCVCGDDPRDPREDSKRKPMMFC